MAVFLVVLGLGLITGWLVNYMADVLPGPGTGKRPRCWNCQSPLPWTTYFHFAPCGVCGRPRRLRTYVVQCVMPACLLYLWRMPGSQLEFPWAPVVFSYLLLIAVVDMEHGLIIRSTSVPGMLLGLGIGIHLHGIEATLLGGVAGYGIMLVLYFSGVLFVRCLARRRLATIDKVALGYGDVNLAGIAGLLLGWPVLIPSVLLSLLLAGFVSLYIVTPMLVRRQYRAFVAIPYAPFLALSVALLLSRP